MKHLPSAIAHPHQPQMRLRLAVESDRELLRAWKNTHKTSFFHQQEITVDQQRAWFSSYLERLHDHVYMVEERAHDAWTPVGTVACRLLDAGQDPATVDLYNIMRGRRTDAGIAEIGAAILLLCDVAAQHYAEPLTCKVLRDNPARSWYERLGFVVTQSRDDHYLLSPARTKG